LNTGIWAIGLDLMAALQSGEPVERVSRTEVTNPLYNFYQAAGGKWIQLVMIESERFWTGFCRAMGLEHLADDPRFNTHTRRAEQHQELIGVLDALFLAHPRDYWAKRLDSERCIWAPIQTLDETVTDPQVRENGYVTNLDHAAAGPFRVLNAPMKFERTPGRVRGPGPELGQHGEEVLLELGYTWDEVLAMKEQGATL
jgi:formyl-CoA transferase